MTGRRGTNLDRVEISVAASEIGFSIVNEFHDAPRQVDNDGIVRTLDLFEERHAHAQGCGQAEEGGDEPEHVDAGKHCTDGTLRARNVVLLRGHVELQINEAQADP